MPADDKTYDYFPFLEEIRKFLRSDAFVQTLRFDGSFEAAKILAQFLVDDQKVMYKGDPNWAAQDELLFGSKMYHHVVDQLAEEIGNNQSKLKVRDVQLAGLKLAEMILVRLQLEVPRE